MTFCVIHVREFIHYLAFLTTEEARRYFEGVWSARVEGVNAAVCSALRLFDGPIHAAQYLLQVQTHKRTLKVKYLLDGE